MVTQKVTLQDVARASNHSVQVVSKILNGGSSSVGFSEKTKVQVLEMAAGQGLRVKSGLMLGLGETWEEIVQTLRDLYDHGCRYLTLGQYLAPSTHHVPMVRYLAPDEFAHWKAVALDMGFLDVASGPLVRSSYRAAAMLEKAL